jgi:pimeloyl-ACP methyl ester carboxylesterase
MLHPHLCGSTAFTIPMQASPLHSAIRLIAPDRPGYGLSTFQRGRRLLDWPDDLAQLADALCIDRFAVVGLSGGGPHTLACALKLVDRLTGVGLVASTAPFDIPSATDGMAKDNQRYLAITRHAPFSALRVLYSWVVHAELRNPEAWLQSQSVRLAAADRAVRASALWRQMEPDNVREAYRQGALGHAWEGGLLTHPWGSHAPMGLSRTHGALARRTSSLRCICGRVRPIRCCQ